MFGISFVSYPLMSICWRPGPRRPTSNFYILIRSRSSGGTDENAQSILNGRHILGMNRSIPRFCNLDLINDQTGVVSVIVTSKSTINLRETKKNRVWKASNNPSTSKIFSCVVNHKKTGPLDTFRCHLRYAILSLGFISVSTIFFTVLLHPWIQSENT